MTFVVYSSHDVVAGDLGLEAERGALDRGIDALGGEFREQGGHLLGVLAALRRLPVRLVDVFLDDLLLEDAVDEGVGGVEIEVLVGEKLLEGGALGGIRREGGGRGGGRPQADAKLLVRRHARLHRRQIGVDALPELIPVVGGVHQRRVREVAEAVPEIHQSVPSLVSIERGARMGPALRLPFRWPDSRCDAAPDRMTPAP